MEHLRSPYRLTQAWLYAGWRLLYGELWQRLWSKRLRLDSVLVIWLFLCGSLFILEQLRQQTYAWCALIGLAFVGGMLCSTWVKRLAAYEIYCAHLLAMPYGLWLGFTGGLLPFTLVAMWIGSAEGLLCKIRFHVFCGIETGLERILLQRILSPRGRSRFFHMISWIGVVLGTMALMTVTAVMSGYQRDIEQKMLATNAHIILQKYGFDFNEHTKVSDKVRAVSAVHAVEPFIFNEAMLRSAQQTTFALIKGIHPQAGTQSSSLQTALHPLNTKLGSLGYPNAIVGKILAEKLQLKLGDTMEVLTFANGTDLLGKSIQRHRLQVAGLFDSGMYEFDARLVYVTLATAQDIFSMPGIVSGLEVRLKPGYQVNALSQQILQNVGHYPYRVLGWQELNQNIFTALRLQKRVMFLVLTFMCLVASFNIVATVFISVVEQSSIIAILLTMGAPAASILYIFLQKGLYIGLQGTLWGVVAGWCLCQIIGIIDLRLAADVYMVEHLHVTIDPAEVLLAALTSIAIAYLASLYPAIKACYLHPVDLLRANR
jgi:lipoprotein-releasing system permease protein